MYKNCHKFQPNLLSPCKVKRKKFHYNNPCQPDESGKKKNSPPSVPDDTPKPVNSLQKALSKDCLGGEQLKIVTEARRARDHNFILEEFSHEQRNNL